MRALPPLSLTVPARQAAVLVRVLGHAESDVTGKPGKEIRRQIGRMTHLQALGDPRLGDPTIASAVRATNVSPPSPRTPPLF